ncbi:MAG TPA: hypothetical protein VGK29_07845 [Paludibaculum sp.]
MRFTVLYIPADIRKWLEKRRRFEEEWAFHCERAAVELESLGLNRQEAVAMAAARMGSHSRYRRNALHEAGCDLGGLLHLLLPQRSLHNACMLPLALAASLGLLYFVNPGRQQVWQTVAGTNFAAEVDPSRTHGCTPRTPPADISLVWRTADPCVERAPWVQPAAIPAAFGKAASWIIVLVGGWPLLRFWWSNRVTWRLMLYGVSTLLLLAGIATTLFVTAMQYHSLVAYPHWGLRVAAYVSYTLAHTLAVAYMYRRWRLDVNSRCPSCLESLRMPMERGHLDSLLIDPPETESVCLQGHGTLTETRWHREFQDSRSFWDDLAGTSAR